MPKSNTTFDSFIPELEVPSCQWITIQQMSPALMMSRPSLRRITARLHIRHIMSIVMLVPHYDGSRWTSDTYRMKFLKKYRKGEIRQTFSSIFQVTAYISARCFIISCFKMLILLHFRTPCYKNKSI